MTNIPKYQQGGSVSPYTLAEIQAGRHQEFLSSDFVDFLTQMATEQQKSEMMEDYSEDFRMSQEKIDAILRRTRKGKKLFKIKGTEGLVEKALPLLGLLAPGIGTLGAGLLGGFSSAYQTKKGSDWALDLAKLARGEILDSPKYKNTFISGKAKEDKWKMEDLLKGYERQAKVSDWDVGLSGIKGGITSAALQKLSSGAKESLTAARAGTPGVAGTPAVAGVKAPFLSKDWLKAVFGPEGFGKDPATIFGAKDSGKNILTNLLMAIIAGRGDK